MNQLLEQEPVTTVYTRHIRPGNEADFEAWFRHISGAVQTFDGNLGTGLIKVPDKKRPEYVTIFRFDSLDHLRAWENSGVRAAYMREIEPLLEDEPRRQIISGLEYWFTLPDRPIPPRWKMSVVTYVAITPLAYIITSLLIPPLRANLGLPSFVASAVASVFITASMSYAVMPFMTRLFAKWLYPA
jgi:uncharacterized protein